MITKIDTLEMITKIDTLDDYLIKCENREIVRHLQKIIKYINNNKKYSDEFEKFLDILKERIKPFEYLHGILYRMGDRNIRDRNVDANNDVETKNRLNTSIKEMFNYELNDEEYESFLNGYFKDEREQYPDDLKMLIYIFLLSKKTDNLETIIKKKNLHHYLYNYYHNGQNKENSEKENSEELIEYINNNTKYSDELQKFREILQTLQFIESGRHMCDLYKLSIVHNNNIETKNRLNTSIKEMFDYVLNDEEYEDLLFWYFISIDTNKINQIEHRSTLRFYPDKPSPKNIIENNNVILMYIYLKDLKKRYYIKKCYSYLMEKYLKSITIIDETIIMYICEFF